MPLGDVRRLQEVVAQAADAASASGDRTRLGRVIGVAAQNWWYLGLPERAIETAQHAAQVSNDADDQLGVIAADSYLGISCHLGGNFARSVEVLNRTAEGGKREFTGARLHPLRWRSINNLLWLAWSLAELGDFPAAVGAGDEAVGRSETHGTRFGLWHGYTGLGLARILRGDLARAPSTLLRALAVADECDLPLMIHVSQTLLGYADLLSGNFEQSIVRLEQALEGLESIGFMAFVPITLTYRSAAHLRNDQPDRAAAGAQRAADITRERRQLGNHAWTLWMLGEIAAHPTALQADVSHARYGEAITLATELGMRPLVAHCHAGLAKLLMQLGQVHDAAEHRRTATAMYQKMDMTYWLEKAHREIEELESRA
jgi:tetratricopeptide (TPR) repeat protein